MGFSTVSSKGSMASSPQYLVHWIHAVWVDLARPELIPACTVFSAMQRSLRKRFLASAVVTEKRFSVGNEG